MPLRLQVVTGYVTRWQNAGTKTVVRELSLQFQVVGYDCKGISGEEREGKLVAKDQVLNNARAFLCLH